MITNNFNIIVLVINTNRIASAAKQPKTALTYSNLYSFFSVSILFSKLVKPARHNVKYFNFIMKINLVFYDDK